MALNSVTNNNSKIITALFFLAGLIALLASTTNESRIFCLFWLSIFFYFCYQIFKPEIFLYLLQTKGIEAQAEILKVRETNWWINRTPVVELTLLVTSPIEAPFEIKTKILIPTRYISYYKIGLTFPIKYDPQNKKRMVILRSSAEIAAGVK